MCVYVCMYIYVCMRLDSQTPSSIFSDELLSLIGTEGIFF